MAERRMITKKVTDDDNFVQLSSSAQALYLHLSMSADDDGFCNQVSSCMFKAHASLQDLEALLQKRFIYQFESGVIVIKHWRMANALRKDRYSPTAFQEELAMLQLKDNGSYTWLPDGCQMVAERLPQVSIDKNSIDKDIIEEAAEPPNKQRKTRKKKDFAPPTVEEVSAHCKEKKYHFDPQEFVRYYDADNWHFKDGKKVSNWKLCCVTWENNWIKKHGNSQETEPDFSWRERERARSENSSFEDHLRRVNNYDNSDFLDLRGN